MAAEQQAKSCPRPLVDDGRLSEQYTEVDFLGTANSNGHLKKDPQCFSHLPKKKRANDVGSIRSTMTPLRGRKGNTDNSY
jgi:hypothetical protein